MIPMRDGVRLHTEVWRDPAQTAALPFLINRTPYGVSSAKSILERSYNDLAQEGYIFIFQDIRGRYASEGSFVMQRPVCPDRAPACIDEGTDTYDTIEYLLKNVGANNGRAGILGVSYGGWLTMMALVRPHPALKAASEQASPADMYLGDDFHHKGSFRLSYGFEYASMMETGKENTQFKFDRYDTYDWYLNLGPLREANRRYLDGARPTWNNFVAHPNYDSFWQSQEVGQFARNPRVPNLNVAGWFDQEDFYGPIRIYREAEKHDRDNRNFLVVGPWNHGGWSAGDGHSLGAIDFGSDTASWYRRVVQAPWFAYWLKDKGRLDLPEALCFQTGSNTWRKYSAWPPTNSSNRNIYFAPNGKLTFEAPKDRNNYDEFLSDPAKPVPYRPRPIPPTYSTSSGWRTWLTGDQRFAESRPDVLVWQSDPLTEDLAIAGDVIAQFTASTSASDADWIVKLIDVYPDSAEREMSGYQLMIAADVLRGRYRSSFEKPEPMRPGVPEKFTLDLLSHAHVFLKGHRIMVQLQSTWFPLIDRNPQKFVPNIFEAKPEDFVKAVHRVYRGSHIVLPVESR